MRDGMVKRLSSLHASLYGTTNGRIGRRLVDNDMLLLTTIGRRTGTKHTVPLLYLREGQRLVVIASYGGRPEHPEWYRNLEPRPQASVQILGDHTDVEATTMTEAEHSEWWARVVDAYSDYAVYQSRTDRQIPVVWLDRKSTTLDNEVSTNG
jgi:deazaflavin-dependent oxidoreductase (nitroreductase family)